MDYIIFLITQLSQFSGTFCIKSQISSYSVRKMSLQSSLLVDIIRKPRIYFSTFLITLLHHLQLVFSDHVSHHICCPCNNPRRTDQVPINQRWREPEANQPKRHAQARSMRCAVRRNVHSKLLSWDV